MKIIEIYSPFDCLVVSLERQLFLSANEHLVLDDEKEIFVYPINKTPCYSFTLNPNKSSPFYKSITQEDKTMIFLLDGLLSNTLNIYSFKINGKTCDIKTGSEKVIFCYDNTEREVALSHQVKTFETNCVGHIAYAICHSEDYQTLIAFNLRNKNIKTLSGKRISILNNIIKIENDFAINEYCLDNDGLSVQSVKSLSHPLVAGTNLFSCLKFGDYVSAYAMLSPSLQKNLSQADFKDFFGKISYFFPLSQTQIFALSNSQPKLYTITFSDDKIVEIEDC